MGLMQWADRENWGALGSEARVYPEVEYIRYDGGKSDSEYAIAPHVDNFSVVSMVALLSEPSEYEGGVSHFESGTDAEDGAPRREERMPAGTAVIFRGEELEHWTTAVTAGRRVILQIELAR